MSIEHPSFLELFEFWLNEKYKGYVKIATYEPEKDTFGLTIRVPNDAYTKFSHYGVGQINGLNVTLVLYNSKYFNIRVCSFETKNAADPSLFQWFSETLKRENFDEMSRIEKLL